VLSRSKNESSDRVVRGLGLGAAVVTAALLLTGCGSSSSSGGGAAAALASKAAGAISSGASSAASAASDGSSTKASSSSTTKITGNSNSSFCVEAVAEQAQEEKLSSAFTSDSPADLEKFENTELLALQSFVSKAPAQIKGAVQTISAADMTLYNALKTAGWDYTKLDPSVLSTLDTPALEAASDQVTAYLKQVCGIDPTDDSS
jgi:hypothetical protein